MKAIQPFIYGKTL